MRGHITGPCALPTALQAHRPWPGLPQRFLVGGEALAPMQKTCGKRHVSCRIIIAYPQPNCNTGLWIFITLLTLGAGVVSVALGQLAAVGPKAVPFELAAIIGMVQSASVVIDEYNVAVHEIGLFTGYGIGRLETGQLFLQQLGCFLQRVFFPRQLVQLLLLRGQIILRLGDVALGFIELPFQLADLILQDGNGIVGRLQLSAESFFALFQRGKFIFPLL